MALTVSLVSIARSMTGNASIQKFEGIRSLGSGSRDSSWNFSGNRRSFLHRSIWASLSPVSFESALLSSSPKILHHDLEAEGRRHELPALAVVVNVEHVEQARDLRRRLNNVRGKLERLPIFPRPPLAHEVPDASKPPFAVKDRELRLTLRLIDNNRDKNAMLGDVFLEFIELVGVK